MILYFYPLGNPEPQVTWRKDGDALPQDHVVRGGLLRLYRVLPEYAGQYVCRADSAVGSEESTVSLSVVCKLNTLQQFQSFSSLVLMYKG